MKKLVCLLVVLVVLFGLFASSASAAGGDIDALLAQIAALQAQLQAMQNGGSTPSAPTYPPPQTNIGGSFSFGSTPTTPYYGSSTNTYGNTSNASFWLRLDPSNNNLLDANWSFNVNSYDPTTFTATCWLHGDRGVAEAIPQNQSWSQSAIYGGSNISESLSFAAQQYQWELSPEMSLGGTLSATDVAFNSTSLREWEGFDQYYSYPKGYNNPPVISQIPAWYAQYDVYGKFLDMNSTMPVGSVYETAGSSSQMSPTPEPSTFALLGAGLVAGIGYFWRRKR
jgi:hypothetical protein